MRNGRIINPEVVFFDEKTFAHRRIDCLGAIIAPGFIDLQINGTTKSVPYSCMNIFVRTFLVVENILSRSTFLLSE